MEPWDTVIVGSGVCGITLAKLLEEKGQRVLVLDKGRGPGGRVASKTLEGFQLDTAADQVVSNREDVMALLGRFAGARWVENAIEGSWQWSFADTAREVMANFAGTVPVQHTFVSHLVHPIPGRIGVMRHGFGEPVWARSVVLTMPVPQAQAVIAHSDFLLDYDLDAVAYSKRQVLLAVFDGDGHVPDSSWSTDMIERVRYRPRPDGMLGVEVFASEAWSEATWDQDATISQGRLLRELGQLFEDARVWGSAVMRWRYAEVTSAHPEPYWVHPDVSGLYLAGDGFGAESPGNWGVSRAVESAMALSERLGV